MKKILTILLLALLLLALVFVFELLFVFMVFRVVLWCFGSAELLLLLSIISHGI